MMSLSGYHVLHSRTSHNPRCFAVAKFAPCLLPDSWLTHLSCLCVLFTLFVLPRQRSPAGTGGDRHPYSGRGHGSAPRGGTPSSFGQQQQQGQGQGHWPIPPRPPRDSSSGGIGGGTGAGPVGWVGAGGVEGSSWGTRSSPLQQQHLPHTPRSMGGGGGRAPGSSWDERGVPGAPDIMHSIHEGNPSPDN